MDGWMDVFTWFKSDPQNLEQMHKYTTTKNI